MNPKHLAAILVAMAATTPAFAAPATYKMDPDHFSIAFLVQHMGYDKVIGMFTKVSGEFVFDEQTHKLSSGTVEVRADSVFSNHDGRDSHLRNQDFLDVEKHPVIRFVAKSYEPTGENQGVLHGDLTLLGQTKPVIVQVTLNKAAKYPFGHGKYTLGVSARAKLLRSQWGMNYGVSMGMVGDEVELMFEFEALRE